MVKIRAIPDYTGYAASKDGRIWSKWIQGTHRIGRHWHEILPQVGNKNHRQVVIYKDGKKVQFAVHRLILLTFVGPRPDEQEARHLNGDPTDNRLENLCWGTRTQNRHDAIRHGTGPQGESHGMAKLTEEEAKEIIRLRSIGKRPCELSEKFKVANSLISMILNGKIWKHLQRPESYPKISRGRRTPSAKITEDDVREARRMHAEGYLQKEIGNRLGISQSMVSKIIRGESWDHVK